MDLDEFVKRCDDRRVGEDPDVLSAMAEDLLAFSQDKTVFADYICSRLRISEDDASAMQSARYTDQVLVLHANSRYMVRLAAWNVPKVRGTSVDTDNKYHSYGFAHNHNFDLLTVGLLGPGYVSRNTEITTPPKFLRAGDLVEMMPRGDVTLSEGKVHLFRKWIDVHSQMPPKRFSMSLNLIVEDKNIPQYSFDVENRMVIDQIGGKDFSLLGLKKISSFPSVL